MKERSPLRFLVFIPSFHGGIAPCACQQSYELARRGHPVTILTHQALHIERMPNLRVVRLLFLAPDRLRGAFIRRAALAATTIVNHWLLALVALVVRPDVVLFDCFSELLAPLWGWPHLLISRMSGIRYAVTVHDPDRRRLMGPLWWHKLSVRAAYAPFAVALAHGVERLRADLFPSHILVWDAPLGMFPIGAPEARECNDSPRVASLRERLGVPSDSRVALVFGYIGDRKNLDIILSAIARSPKLHLLVAGRRASAKDRPVEFYRRLAQSLGISDRVHFFDEYVPDDQVESFFRATDVVLLTYDARFVSQSAVLHLAANWDKPVIASSGPGPLVDTVARYGLGIIVEAGSEEDLVRALEKVRRCEYPQMDWRGFREAASWSTNVDCLLEALEQLPASVGEAIRSGRGGRIRSGATS